MARTTNQNVSAEKNTGGASAAPGALTGSQSIGSGRAWSGMLFQGWVSLAVWMAFGLLLEGLVGFKTPAYLQDDERRELFRLAHTHGTFLGLVLVLAAMCGQRFVVSLPPAARIALQIGSVLIPFGFLLGGIRHFESDPGLGIWLVPPGALLVIFGVTALALGIRASAQGKE